jgi:hypothetical protein
LIEIFIRGADGATRAGTATGGFFAGAADDASEPDDDSVSESESEDEEELDSVSLELLALLDVSLVLLPSIAAAARALAVAPGGSRRAAAVDSSGCGGSGV